MTTEIARFMRTLERTWDDHVDALLVARDPVAALAHATAEPSVRHLPSMTGAEGRTALMRFYAEHLIHHLPTDLVRMRVSRTVDRFRLVDEETTSFTHDRELPWLLPGGGATNRRVKVLTITVVSFDRGAIASQRTLWDQSALLEQLELPGFTSRRRQGP